MWAATALTRRRGGRIAGDYKPTGKLSFSWPRSMALVTMHRGDSSYDPLFPYEYGLSY